MFHKTCFRACILLVFIAQTLLVSRQVAAQDPIRVQSDEVLVPTVVFDKELYAQLNKQEPHHRTTYGKMVAKNAKLWNDIVVKNLTVKDFHLFEDDQEQKIGSVKLEPPAFRVVQDNLGKHPEIAGSGGGIWAYPDLPRDDLSVWLAWPQYVLAYVPQRSAAGSCHRIQVNAARTDLIVWTRSEYCNTPHPASDPLSGTGFGNKLEKAAKAGTSSGIDLKLNVATFADAPNAARVFLSASFPEEALQHEIRNGILYATIGSLVLVYSEDGTLAARYSDFACCDYGDKKESKTTENEMTAPSTTGGRALLPNRYETQFSLPPGKYKMRLVVSDGLHFGVEEAPLTVEGYDADKLSVTGVVLARRVRQLPQNETEAERIADSYSQLISKEVEFTPTANTDFFRGDTLFAYFEINNPLVAGQSGAKVLANLRILDSRSGSVADTFEPVDTVAYVKAGDPLIAVGRGLMLEHLPPGAYRLEVRASNAGGQSTEWKSAEFGVMEVPPLELNAAASPTDKKDEVIVNVTALDSGNRFVGNLSSGDFQIFEDEKRQAITSFKMTSGRSTTGAPAPIVILFDLLNTIPRQREYIASRIIKVLEPLEQDEGIYLYLLTNEGALYRVRPRRNMQAAAIAQGSNGGAPDVNATEGTPWTKEIRPLLNHAIDEVHGFRLMDFKDVGMRAVTTFDRLGQIEGEMAYVQGPKTILWITSGVPNSIAHPYGGCENQTFYGVSDSYLAGRCGWECHPSLSDTKCLDYMPFFQHFSAEAVASNTTVSTVAVTDSRLQNFDRGTPGNTLQQLADLTGGRVYVSGNSEIETAIRDALQSTRGRYTMAYTAPVSDGQRHKLRVACAREGIRLIAPQERFAISSGDQSNSKP